MGRNTKKKIILGAILAGTIALAGMQTAGARPWGGGQWCDGCGRGYGGQGSLQLDESTLAARDAFLKDTVELRKSMAMKRAEQKALMNNDNPDAKRIAELSGELFELREQLAAKAQEAGLKDIGMRGPGLGGGCDGKGPGGLQRPL
jgi:zinc resistance-associated protein